MKNNIGSEFMKKTQHSYLGESEQRMGVLQPPIEISYSDNTPLIDLTDVVDFPKISVDFNQLLENRKSVRNYSNTPLTNLELSYLLWSTQGIKNTISKDTPTGPIHVTFRTAPSAGARHPFETYLLINNVEGIEAGLYRYIATKHKLQIVEAEKEIKEKIVEACLSQEFINTSAVTFIWVADSKRTKWRYGERGIRYILLDAGHVCQNLYLAAETINSGVCAIASFDDEELNKVLQLDGENVFVTYIGTVGKK